MSDASPAATCSSAAPSRSATRSSGSTTPTRRILNPTVERYEAQVTRAARRFPDMTVPNRPKGIAGVYDVAEDWTPIYDKTALPGFYVGIGTSGNQFKNAPVIGALMDRITPAA